MTSKKAPLKDFQYIKLLFLFNFAPALYSGIKEQNTISVNLN